jgi:predicted nucleotidyltransferase
MGGLEAVDVRYRDLFEQAPEVLGPDPRVVRVEVGGSVGAGTADRWSDLDLVVVTEPAEHEVFLADWPTWLRSITPTVFARTPIAPFVINAVTQDGLTLDLSVWPGEVPSFEPPGQYTVGALSSQRFDEVGPALEYAVEEQLRGLVGPFISLLRREEHLRHLTGVPHLIGLLTTVFLAETGAPPPGKHWNQAFTAEQRGAVAALPPVSATREGIVAFGLGLAELLVRRARPLYPAFDLVWPVELAEVAAGRIRSELEIDVSSWLR